AVQADARDPRHDGAGTPLGRRADSTSLPRRGGAHAAQSGVRAASHRAAHGSLDNRVRVRERADRAPDHPAAGDPEGLKGRLAMGLMLLTITTFLAVTGLVLATYHALTAESAVERRLRTLVPGGAAV